LDSAFEFLVTTKVLNPSILKPLKGHSVLELQQLDQPWINQDRFAIAVFQIPVLPAMRTEALAVLAADRFHGQAKQNLLPRNVVDFNEVTRIEADLRIPFMKCNLSMEWMLCIRLIKLIELGHYWKLNRLKAARTRHSDLRRQPASNANLERLPLGCEVDLNLGQNLNLRGVKA
jgi:hypothetical protein